MRLQQIMPGAALELARGQIGVLADIQFVDDTASLRVHHFSFNSDCPLNAMPSEVLVLANIRMQVGWNEF